MNNHLVLLSGSSVTGKSFSLKNLKDPKGVMYLCTESNKELPFKNDFLALNITDPDMLTQAFEEAEGMKHIHTIAVDSLTFMMDQLETKLVQNVEDSRGGWGDFAEFFKVLMLDTVASSTKNVIFTAHTFSFYNKADMVMECKVPVKGSLKNNGIEAFFSTVISTKKMPIEDLSEYSSIFLNITEEEEDLGFKYVFQTRLTKETVNERIRSHHLMWGKEETYIDNNMQFVLDRLHEYHK